MSSIYKQGESRNQQLLFPPSIDDYVDSNNTVRAIDAYVDILDLSSLKFSYIASKSSNTHKKYKTNNNDGAKGYNPSLLLKIYIYGYLNKIRSSRNLEKECKRNIELIWLCSGLTPAYHTISDFRKNNPKGLKQVFKEFVLLCKNINLIGNGLKAVDGAFLRANASKNTLILKKNITKDLLKIEKDISKYLDSLDVNDKEKQITLLSQKNIKELPKEIRYLKHKQKELFCNLKLLEKTNKTQHNKTDKDASLMVKPAHNLMAYNSQIVTDEKHKLIVATNISSKGLDNQLMHKMGLETKENLELSKSDTLDIVGDTGYYSSKEIKKCNEDNINAYIPEGKIKQVQESKGKFTRDKFVYHVCGEEDDSNSNINKDNNNNKDKDYYICPNNKKLNRRNKPQIKSNKTNFVYTGSSAICKACPLKDTCIPAKANYKQIYRWEHEEVVESHRSKMKLEISKKIVKKRSSLVEHPFGTIKRTLGWDHFLVRGAHKVSGENSLIMFTYNFKRVINIIGIDLFKKLINAIKVQDMNIIDEVKQEIEVYILMIRVYFRLFYGFGLYFRD